MKVSDEITKELPKVLKDAHKEIPEHLIHDARLRGNPRGVFGRYERRKSAQWLSWWVGVMVWALYLFNHFPMEWMRQTDPESKPHAFWVLMGPPLIVLYQWLKDNSDKLTHK